jgi:hypothetical protein
MNRHFYIGLLLLAASLPAVAQVTFRDITKQAGISFVHNNGAAGKKWLPETMGSGAAFLDYDNDGYPDILLVNGKDWNAGGKASTLKLYHNNRNGTFTDVTAKAGLAISLYGMGATVGDYDNDGFDDVFITALGQSRLFHNNGNGTFTDVTKAAGMWGPNEFSTSAAWLDYDRNGKLDLVVANYVQWSQDGDIYCTMDGTHKSYCTPESYKGASVRLWHNLGNGKFEDATAKAGLFDNSSKSLGVAVLDVNGDGWSDIVVANDTQPNKLYVNNGKGGFNEQAVSAGIAFSEDGVARAGMGIDAADYDHSGRQSIIIGNFSNQMMALYHNEGNGLFVDEAPRSEVGRKSLLSLGFATFFFDYDLDGWLDIFVANGHIENEIERIQKRVKYAESPHLFHNQGKGNFVEATQSVGPDLGVPRVGRSAAYADIDNDGDLDILMTTNGGSAVLFRNDGGNANNTVHIKLMGVRSNRDGIGTLATVTAGGAKQTELLRSGSGYLSSNELVLTFGLGKAKQADNIELRWPSGQVDKLSNVTAGQTITVKEGTGIVQQRPFGAAAATGAPAKAKTLR